MAQTKKRTERTGRTGAAAEHVDRDTLTSSAVADPHSTAFAERQRDPNRYDNPTIATPGILDDIDDDADDETIVGLNALVDPDAPSDLDPSVDNRDQVQPMLETLADEAQDDPAVAVAALNAHESDGVDVEALLEEQKAKREENRAALAESREANRAASDKAISERTGDKVAVDRTTGATVETKK